MKISLFIIFHILFAAIQSNVNDLPKMVWTFWSKDIQQLPAFQYRCLKSFENNLKYDGWQVMLLNNDNFRSYIDDRQNFDKLSKKQIFSQNKQLLLDLVKIFILKSKGGIWLDINIILVENFNWLYHLGSKNIDASQFQVFMFNSQQQNQISTGIEKNNLMSEMLFHSWFIAAVPNSRILNGWLQLWANVETQKQQQYARMKEQQIFNLYLKGSLFNIISQQRKTVNAKSLIWTINANDGPYLFKNDEDQYLRLTTIQQLKRQHLQPKYLIKVSNQNAFYTFRNVFVNQFNNQHNKQELKNPKFSLVQYFTNGKLHTGQILCYNPDFVVLNSIFHKHLAKGEDQIMYFVDDKEEYKKSCKQVDLIEGIYFFSSFMFSLLSILGLFFGIQWVIGKIGA